MKNQIIASIAAIPFAFLSATTANAAALTGEFSFDGSDYETQLTLSNTKLDFVSDDATQINLKGQTDSFTAFEDAYIYDLDNPLNPNPSVFIDLGEPDGKNLLYATSLGEYQYSNLGRITGISIGFEGYFESDTGEISQAVGGITLQANGSIADVKKKVASGNLTATFSGIAVATKSTPEPTTLFGLGIVAAGLTVTRRYSHKS